MRLAAAAFQRRRPRYLKVTGGVSAKQSVLYPYYSVVSVILVMLVLAYLPGGMAWIMGILLCL